LDRDQIADVNHIRALLSALAEGRDLIELGAYVPGTNPTLDRALEVRDALDVLLRQDASSISSWDEARRMLTEVKAS
jgi:flagellum-specific ATP synthase